MFSPHLHTPGRSFSCLELAWGRARAPACLFSPFWAPPIRKSDAEGGERVPNVTPKARKSPPGDLPESTKIRLSGLRGCPGPPGRSRGTPPARKVHQKSLFVPPAAGGVACKNPPRLCNPCGAQPNGVSGYTVPVHTSVQIRVQLFVYTTLLKNCNT